MKNYLFIFILTVLPLSGIAEELAISEISESCLYDTQIEFTDSLSWKFIDMNGIVTDGGGYGVYRSFTVVVMEPTKGEVTYKAGKLIATPEDSDLNLFVSSLAARCKSTVNKHRLKGAKKTAPQR